jgi:hypothetical protein
LLSPSSESNYCSGEEIPNGGPVIIMWYVEENTSEAFGAVGRTKLSLRILRAFTVLRISHGGAREFHGNI